MASASFVALVFISIPNYVRPSAEALLRTCTERLVPSTRKSGHGTVAEVSRSITNYLNMFLADIA